MFSKICYFGKLSFFLSELVLVSFIEVLWMITKKLLSASLVIDYSDKTKVVNHNLKTIKLVIIIVIFPQSIVVHACGWPVIGLGWFS